MAEAVATGLANLNPSSRFSETLILGAHAKNAGSLNE
jgi:hypothetical protein